MKIAHCALLAGLVLTPACSFKAEPTCTKGTYAAWRALQPRGENYVSLCDSIADPVIDVAQGIASMTIVDEISLRRLRFTGTLQTHAYREGFRTKEAAIRWATAQ